ncbi:hypothetical protein VE02_01559 [Pseudogymnoascus sp. 03VT05]|nr:hypothetical protein VE02_01559 [Pseudogymnoascus sp. 03VT05]
MHFFSVVSLCLLCSSLAAAGPLPRDKFRKLQFRQVAPFKNTTSTTDSAAATIDVVPVALTETPVDTTAATTTTSSTTELSTTSTATTLSTSGFVNTTSTAATTVGDVPIITSTSLTATAAGDGANAAQTAIGASQTTISSNLSGGSIVAGTGNFSRTTLVSANSNTDASADSKPTTGTQVFPFAESLTDTPGAVSTTTEAPFTFLSDPVTPTTLSTRTTNAPVAITVTGVGVVVPVTPSFFTSASPLPTTTSDTSIIEVPTIISGTPTALSSTASDAASISAENLRLAREYNNIYATLTPDSICAPDSMACVDGKRATCIDGRYTLSGCGFDSQLCYAMPLTQSPGVVVNCEDIATAERVLGLPNSLSVTIGTVPVVVPSTTAEVDQATTVADAVPTTTAADAAVTAAAVQSPGSNAGQGETDEATTVLHRTIVSTITIAVSDFAPTTVAPAADTPTAVAVADGSGSIISVVPVAAAAAGGSGGKEEGPVTVTVTRSVTVTEQFTVTRAGVTATVTVG